MAPEISIVVPAYNEIDRIEKTLKSILQHFENSIIKYEIIVVNDGSNDATADVVARLIKKENVIKLIQLPKNLGKGNAVREGMLTAAGRIRLFMDADGSTAISELDKLLQAILDGYEVVVGSRLVSGAKKHVKQNIFREILGWVFRLLTIAIIDTGIIDTQNGFKAFTRQAAIKIFSELKTTGWSFDVEVLVLARKNKFRIKEVPIAWSNDGRSKMRFRHMVIMPLDLIKIRLRLITGT